MNLRNIQQGHIVLTNCDPSVGYEIQKIRPTVVIQGKELNELVHTFTVVPLTTGTEIVLPGDVIVIPDAINRLQKTSIMRTSKLHSFDESRFLRVIGLCSPEVLKEAKEQIKKIFHLDE